MPVGRRRAGQHIVENPLAGKIAFYFAEVALEETVGLL
jgi:hypothetical protein